MRGKRNTKSPLTAKHRITPAGAGKTNAEYPRKTRLQDHPRRCGENVILLDETAPLAGSPPQVRGKPLITPQVRSERGITPAGAGKTGESAGNYTQPQDHPRRCGENVNEAVLYTEQAGSPPQVRGKRFMRYPQYGQYRITPAGAGKTFRTAACLDFVKDHPRRCGENLDQLRRRIRN